ncbi:hypothetical protein UO65_0861 [Actinokineospora spheciospongiae]|uniref:Uncharacterized protein n=1 Tax=Actinokineospora spheciospongiae TaxID=909613 RepID=W7J434_9PSEU|nr:hypothetical protein UO65_0861 [Actinokineospora spheciospongiae]
MLAVAGADVEDGPGVPGAVGGEARRVQVDHLFSGDAAHGAEDSAATDPGAPVGAGVRRHRAVRRRRVSPAR